MFSYSELAFAVCVFICGKVLAKAGKPYYNEPEQSKGKEETA